MLDAVMLILIGIAFAAAAGYVSFCARVLEPSGPSQDHPT
jgi:hypothetical protein